MDPKLFEKYSYRKIQEWRKMYSIKSYAVTPCFNIPENLVYSNVDISSFSGFLTVDVAM